MRVDGTNMMVFDDFGKSRNPGKLIGSASSCGILRKGRDCEKIISADHGAMRIGYMAVPGWKRHGIAYGPFQRAPGLAFAIFLLNGHNSSQTNEHGISEKRRFFWGLMRRLLVWVPTTCLLHPRLRGKIHPPKPHDCNWPHIRENLAVGFFQSEAPSKPEKQGSAFLVHADGIYNGQLMVSCRARKMPVVESLQNNPAYYIVVLRDHGAIYYSSTYSGAKSLAGYPHMRPVGLDPFTRGKEVYAGAYQSILGEIGFHVDTRIYGVKVLQVERLRAWYGTAQMADRMCGIGGLEAQKTDAGVAWTVHRGRFERTPSGAHALDEGSLAAVYAPEASGLIHVVVEARSSFGVTFRMKSVDHFWCLLCQKKGVELFLVSGGKWILKSRDSARFHWGQPSSVLILDDGSRFGAFLDGKRLFGMECEDGDLSDGTGAGLYVNAESSKTLFRDFESHARELTIPEELDLGAPWDPSGGVSRVTDFFKGHAGELSGRLTHTGDRTWRKVIGLGRFLLDGKGALKVNADARTPNPGRTVYTVPWGIGDFADLETEILPPGTEQGQGEKGRAGLVFWQDPDNYIIVNTYLDDWKVGKSISSFFFLNGEEDTYHAVWTNVGHRIHWGRPYTLRVAFNGLMYVVSLNREPVLYRALTDVYPNAKRLTINSVGIAANWEFGDDTGSQFRYFIAKGPS